MVVRALAVTVVGAISLAGCSRGDEPGPVIREIPMAPAEGADLICGMDRIDIETVTGSPVDRVEGELEVTDGWGSGECSAWAPEASSIHGPVVNVRLFGAASAEGDEARAMMAGEITGVRPADEVYDSRVGAIFGDVLDSRGSMTSIGTSYIFVGDTLVEMLLTRGDVGRDRPADQLALTEQVVATYGLEPGEGAS